MRRMVASFVALTLGSIAGQAWPDSNSPALDGEEIEVAPALRPALEAHVNKQAPSQPLRKATKLWVRALMPDQPTWTSYASRPDGLFHIAASSIVLGRLDRRSCVSLHGILDLACRSSWGADFAQGPDDIPKTLLKASVFRVESIRINGRLPPQGAGEHFTMEAQMQATTTSSTTKGVTGVQRDHVVRKSCDVQGEMPAAEVPKGFRGKALRVRCTESTTNQTLKIPELVVAYAFLVDSSVFVALGVESPSKVSYTYADIEYEN